MTDISSMWRIKVMTEQFGACGIGWKYDIVKQWTEPVCDGQIAAFCSINLFIKIGEMWSEPIPGTGGNMMIVKERSGLRADDECYKKALTDAISVACKALGIGADVYWSRDSKYTQPDVKFVCCDCGKPFEETVVKDKKLTPADLFAMSAKMNTDGKSRCGACMEKSGTKR